MPLMTPRSVSFMRHLVSFGLLVSGHAWAGSGAGPVTITYGPDATAVPVLSDMMVLMLVALVAVLAYRALRAGATGRPLASIVALGIFAVGGGLSGRLESVAMATGTTLVNLTAPSGGSASVSTFGVDVQLTNQTSVPQRIKTIQPTPPDSVGTPSSTPKCQPGATVLSPSGSCFVLFTAG